MVDFRYHLVSLIAIFLALALGIAREAMVRGDGSAEAGERVAARVRRIAVQRLGEQVERHAGHGRILHQNGGPGT